MILYTGHDRIYSPPASAREAALSTAADDTLARKVALGRTTAWDLFAISRREDLGCTQWAQRTIDRLVASAVVDTGICTDCEDIGYYGLERSDNEDVLVGLLRTVKGVTHFERLTASGEWDECEPVGPVRILSAQTANDLAEVILSGGSGLVERYYWPVAWLAPGSPVLADAAAVVKDEGSLLESQEKAVASETEEPGPDEEGWYNYAVVDDLDTTAVVSVIRMKPGPVVQRFDGGNTGWVDDDALLADLRGPTPPPLVALTAEQLAEVQSQIGNAPAEQTNDGSTVAAVSPDPRAEKLRRYWSLGGKGGLKIRWGTPGDWKRCYKHLRKFMGVRAKGYCSNLHKRNTGVWPGSKLNPGRRASAEISTEQLLLASLESGHWSGDDGRTVDMAGFAGIKDGVYAEHLDNLVLMKAVVAGAFPVKPPTEWFTDPGLSAPTPLTVEDDGRVFGHIATFDVAHIGLPGKVHAPRSRSNYAYFKTGVLRTADGSDVSVGQLTLAGGHAPLAADAGQAAAHYDETGSAVADVTVGEDRYGIWVAGALRPEIKPSQVRTLRASAPSGDWRPINGSLELVAVCQVNVPGFPVARARVASGAITALVAAGARPLAVRQMAVLADAEIADRLTRIEAEIFKDEDDIVAALEDEVVAVDDEPDPQERPETDSVVDEPVDAVARARAAVRDRQRAALRARVHGAEASGLAAAASERKGIGGFPISDEASLKKAIQAYGRAKPEDQKATRAHIISEAKKLGKMDLIPDNWPEKKSVKVAVVKSSGEVVEGKA